MDLKKLREVAGLPILSEGTVLMEGKRKKLPGYGPSENFEDVFSGRKAAKMEEEFGDLGSIISMNKLKPAQKFSLTKVLESINLEGHPDTWTIWHFEGVTLIQQDGDGGSNAGIQGVKGTFSGEDVANSYFQYALEDASDEEEKIKIEFVLFVLSKM